jgi:hypothetical protein
MNTPPILYMGDTSINGAAAYLAGLMTAWGWNFDYIPSDQPIEPASITDSRRLFILSDYPSRLMPAQVQRAIADRIAQGAGLLMIGGWESYCGHGGNWAGTTIAEILPVKIASTDDRINCDQPALVTRKMDHPITQGLPWNDRPPTIGGLNRIEPKPGAQVLLQVQRFAAKSRDSAQGPIITFQPTEQHPLLIVGQHQQGRTASLATDVAPHWVGGLVDWGTGRTTGHARGSHAVEVGDQYAAFLRKLLDWTGSLGSAR